MCLLFPTLVGFHIFPPCIVDGALALEKKVERRTPFLLRLVHLSVPSQAPLLRSEWAGFASNHHDSKT